MARLTPKPEVIRRLFALSGNLCAFPNCNHVLINNDGKFIAQVCHIEGAEVGGERYSESQTDEERRAFGNLMIMCYQHHVETNDELTYTSTLLKRFKAEHEARFVNNIYSLPLGLEDKIVEEIQRRLEQIYGIITESKTLIEEGNQTGKENKASLAQIQVMLREIQSANVLKIDDSNIYAEKLDFIKQLRSEHKAQTALDAALKFKSTKWIQIDDELKFKLIANISSILFELGRQKEAAIYLLELNEIDYEQGETQAYISLAYAILDDRPKFEKAFEKAVSINGQSINLWIAYIHIQGDSIAARTIADAVPEVLHEKPEILFALGEAYVDRGLEAEGFAMLEKALALSSVELRSPWQIKGIYAAKRLVNIVTIERVLFKKFTESEKQQIRAAVDEISEAWALVRDTELAGSGWHMLMNRGIAYKVLGELGKADQDLEEAFRLSKRFEALKNLILHYIETDRLDKACALLRSGDEQSLDEYEKLDWQALKARVLTLQGKPDDAVALLDTQLILYKDEHKLRLFDLITLIYFECGAYEQALPYAIQMKDAFKEQPNGYLATAICYSRMGNTAQALELLDFALSLAEYSPQKSLYAFQTGVEYEALKQFQKAAESFELILNEHIYDLTFSNLIRVYFRGNFFEKCIALCIKGKELVPEDVTLDELLFRAYDELGETDKAEEVLNEHFKWANTDSFDHFRLLGIQLYKRIGKGEKAVQLALEISTPERLQLSQRMIVARVLLEYQRINEGLEMAYEARLDNYESSAGHEAYLQTCAVRPKGRDEELSPDSIALNVAFILRDGAEKERTFFLTDDKRMSGSEVVRTSDSLALKVLGRQRGDVVEMANNYGVGNKLTIVSILNKYAYAFLDSQKLLETRYADESGMIFFHGGQNGDAGVKEFMREQVLKANKQKDELHRIYQDDVATLGMLAQYQSTSQVEVWFQIMGSDIASLHCYTHDESADIAHVVENELYVVLDCISLLTVFFLLNRPELLSNCGFKWAVTRSAIEDFSAHKEKLKLSGPTDSVGIQNGELHRFELTQEHIDAHIVTLDQIIEWCNKNALIKTPRRIIKSIEEEDISDIMGVSSHDTILLANELDGAVMSDDEKLKNLALGMHGSPTFSTYQLIVYNARLKFLSPEQFGDCYRSLIRANYIFIPIIGPDLWNFFDENGFKVQHSFITAVKGLFIMRPDLVAAVITDFGKMVYLNLSVAAVRDSVMLYLFKEIKKHEHFPLIKTMIGAISQRVFSLMPVQRNEFLSLLYAA